MNSNIHKVKIEVCVAHFEEAQIAAERGADQIELCSQLELDGLTPHREDIRRSISELDIPIKVMIRPYAGNFISSPEVIGKMKTEIEMVKSIGVEHVVFGLTTKEQKLDLIEIRELVAHCGNMSITIHKAIDTCIDPVEEVKNLLQIKQVHSILTSGGAQSAFQGASVINQMVKAASGQIEIIAAGGITNENLIQIKSMIQTSCFHGRKIVGTLC